MATATKNRPMLELHMETDPGGEVSPVIPVTWSFTDDLVDKLARKGYANPYLIITVGYDKPYGPEQQIHEYVVTKTYVRRLLDGSPKEYLQFSRPGVNIVMAFVVNIETKDQEQRLWKWQRHPRDMRFDYAPKKGDFKLFSWDINSEARNIARFRHDVVVPAEMFAREPSAPAKALVRQFFPFQEFDQCDFRRRFLVSLAASVPVQLYGIVARLASLLFAVVFAMRGIEPRLLFALNPHDFGNALGTSFWYRTNDFRKRTGLIKWFSPPQLILYVLIAAGLLLPGWLFTVLAHIHSVRGELVVGQYTFGDVLIMTAIVDPIFAVISAFLFFFMTEQGSRRRHRWLDARRSQTNVIAASPDTFELLRVQAHRTAGRTPNQVVNKTVRLKFLDLKSKVCKPFARSY